MAPEALTLFVEPGEHERHNYYHCVGGGQLMVRSNCYEQPWDESTGLTGMFDDWFPEIPIRRQKVFIGIGHLAGAYDDTENIKKLRNVYPKVFEILEAANIDWLWFTGIRIGYNDCGHVDDYPIVLLLNVRTGAETFERVEPVAREIRSALVNNNLPHVHVEVREDDFERYGATAALEKTVEGLRTPRGHWVVHNKPNSWLINSELTYRDCHRICGSTLGWNIASASGNVDGTAGPFISFKHPKMKGKICALSCNHIFRRSDDGIEAPDQYETATHNAEGLRVSQGTLPRQEALLEKIHRDGEFKSERTRNWDWYERRLAEEEDIKERKKLIMRQAAEADRMKLGSELISGLENLLSSKDRSVGTVCAVSDSKLYGRTAPAGRDAEPHTGFVPDWALVELDEDKFKMARNMLYLGQEGNATLTVSRVLHPVEYDETSLVRPHKTGDQSKLMNLCDSSSLGMRDLWEQNHWLHMTGEYLKKSDMRDGIPPMRVVKGGIETGVTCGVTNGVEAVVRTAVRCGDTGLKKHVGAYEIGVIQYVDRESVDSHPIRAGFGWSGDSGSAVMDDEGRYVGELVGGGGNLSMVTPAWVIMADIQRVTKMKPYIIPSEPFGDAPEFSYRDCPLLKGHSSGG